MNVTQNSKYSGSEANFFVLKLIKNLEKELFLSQ